METIKHEGKAYILYNIDTPFGPEKLYFVKEKYTNNKTLAVEAYNADGEPYATLTVNLCDPQQVRRNHAFLDVNNCGWIARQLTTSLGIARKARVGYTRQSGFVTYPLYEWNVDKFREGGEKPKYYVDVQYRRDGETYGDMYYTFEVKPETETEDLEEAKDMARNEAAEAAPYDSDCGICIYIVEDEEGNAVYSAVNVDRETAMSAGVEADAYITDTNPSDR